MSALLTSTEAKNVKFKNMMVEKLKPLTMRPPLGIIENSEHAHFAAYFCGVLSSVRWYC